MLARGVPYFLSIGSYEMIKCPRGGCRGSLLHDDYYKVYTCTMCSRITYEAELEVYLASFQIKPIIQVKLFEAIYDE